MRTAREVAHAIVCERQDSEWCHWTTDRSVHAHYCDSLTAAIEARDAEHGAEFDKLYDDRMSVAAERSRLRSALGRIAAYDTDFAVGPAENVNRLQAIAESALAPNGGEGTAK